MLFNYHFLQHLVPRLQQELQQAWLVTAFSQNRDELVLGFGREQGDFYMRLSFGTVKPFLDFPEQFNRARRNSVDLFIHVLGQPVKGVFLLPNERALTIDLEGGWHLLLKLFGKHGNVLLFDGDELVALFRHSLGKDKQASFGQYGRPLDQSPEAWLASGANLRATFPTLGDLAETWLKQRGYDQASPEEKYALIQQALGIMAQGQAHVINEEDEPRLTLFPQPDKEVITDAIAAANAYAKAVFRRYGLEYEREQLVKTLQKRLQQTQNYLDKTWQRLSELEDGLQPNQIGDLIMAHLHLIRIGADKVSVPNFYGEGEAEIKLNPALSAHKNAESYYRKSRNRKIEVARLSDNLQAREAELALYQQHLAGVNSLHTVRELRAYIKQHELEPMTAEQAEAKPWLRFEHMGFEILVGRHSQGNEQLTFGTAHKNDLWLHARDAPGSHVIIRQQAGKPYPTPVIEHAAALAARFSKRRTETLCPVQVTQRKHVHKIKGAAAGMVKLDREEVIMVRPAELSGI